MNLQILPLAITMMAGPQIMLAILIVTLPEVKKLSVAYISAVFLATSLGVIITLFVFSLLGSKVDFSEMNGKTGIIIQIILVFILIYLAAKTYLHRHEQQTPRWLQSAQHLSAKKVFRDGLLLIFLMPTDIIVLLTVGLNLKTNNLNYISALPFILLTTLICALPFLAYLIFRKKAEVVMPKVRDWMLNNSWVVNLAVYAIFIYLILAG